MEQVAARTSKEVLDTLVTLLRTFPSDRWDLAPKQRLDLALTAQTMVSQAQAVAARLLAEADQADASLRSAGTPPGTFLASRQKLTPKQAAGLVYRARELSEHPQAREAVQQGSITMDHATAVGKALRQMPAHFTPAQTAQAEAMLVDLAGRRTPDDVLRAAARVAEQIDPVDANQAEAMRLTREREAAVRNRALVWWHEAGSVAFKGSLPQVEGEAFTALINAFTNQSRRNAIEAGDSHADEVTPAQRRADALVSLVRLAQARVPGASPAISRLSPSPEQPGDTAPGLASLALTPNLAGDRPVIMVTLDYHKLKADAANAAVLPGGRPLAKGDLRRLACDANVIPAVLGSASEPLDVGRAQRLVTPPIRKALHLRDKHCAFPDCDHTAALCDAHHLRPWWDGGPTSLDNLVLLCPHHHALVEPDPNSQRDQWSVSIASDGHPTFQPPDRYPDRQPIRHTDAPPIPDNTGPPG